MADVRNGIPHESWPVYEFAWGNNERRSELKGRKCNIVARGTKGTVLVEFIDNGERVTTSFRALRRSDK